MTTDVLIVGAGPTGLMLANQLGRRGIRPIIIDRHSGPAEQTRAMAVQARTLEIYAKLGIAKRALELGQPGYGANLWTHGRRQARIPFEDMGKDLSPFPYVLMLGQDDNERVMGDYLRNWDIAVQWNTELVSLEQRADHVLATIKDAEGRTREITAAYVAGCDGGRSAVREMNGIGFPGAPYEHTFYVADTEATGPMVPNELNVFLWREGFHLLFPMRGRDRWRVIGIIPAALREKADLQFDDLVPALQREGGASLDFKLCTWFSTYRIHHRCTEKFRDRRCFLLGDAAHVHSPAGGQGMNTGLQDAYNLGWKLALVLSGRADDALLDTYEAERMPVAHRLLETTDQAFKLAVSDTWIAGILRTRVMAKVVAFAMRFHRVRRLAYMTVSQIAIRYPKSPLSRTLAASGDAPRAGDRFPWLRVSLQPNWPIIDIFEELDDTRFNLVTIGQPAPAGERLGLGDLVRVHAIPADERNAQQLAAASIPSPSYYIVRPDGYIGLAGAEYDEQEVKRWFADCHVTGAPRHLPEEAAAKAADAAA
jgi:2-polyprenyl-6-methoxyphenol hydroxylase-like FAD-dependent oxidoreductase